MEDCSCKRASRSDAHLPAEEEAKKEEETREYFDGIFPERHSKPQRSEHSAQYVDTLPTTGNEIPPEYLEFQRLETDPQKLVYKGGSEVTEDFVETDYYKDLNGVDKKHHTTGTGFIKMGEAKGDGFSLVPDSDTTCHASSGGNPATNEWIPSTDDSVTAASGKPSRSDN